MLPFRPSLSVSRVSRISATTAARRLHARLLPLSGPPLPACRSCCRQNIFSLPPSPFTWFLFQFVESIGRPRNRACTACGLLFAHVPSGLLGWPSSTRFFRVQLFFSFVFNVVTLPGSPADSLVLFLSQSEGCCEPCPISSSATSWRSHHSRHAPELARRDTAQSLRATYRLRLILVHQSLVPIH